MPSFSPFGCTKLLPPTHLPLAHHYSQGHCWKWLHKLLTHSYICCSYSWSLMMGYTDIGLTTTSSELFQADTKSCRDISRLFKEWISCSWWLSQWAWSCVDESQSSITNYYTSEFLPSKEFPLSGQCVSTHKHSHPSTCAVVKQYLKWQSKMKQRKELKQDVTL